MYTLIVTVYEITHRDECRAALFEGSPDAESPIATAHLSMPHKRGSGPASHEAIVDSAVLVCQELALNCPTPLF
jgi:hypothetical protein